MSKRKDIIKILKRSNKDGTMLSEYAQKKHLYEEILEYCLKHNICYKKEILKV